MTVGLSTTAMMANLMHQSVYLRVRILAAIVFGLLLIMLSACLSPNHKWKEFYFLIISSVVVASFSMTAWLAAFLLTRLRLGFDSSSLLALIASILVFVASRRHVLMLSVSRRKRGQIA